MVLADAHAIEKQTEENLETSCFICISQGMPCYTRVTNTPPHLSGL